MKSSFASQSSGQTPSQLRTGMPQRSRQPSRDRMENVINKTHLTEYKWQSPRFREWFAENHTTYGGWAKSLDECQDELLREYTHELNRYMLQAYADAEKLLVTAKANIRQFQQGFKTINDDDKLAVHALYPDRWDSGAEFFTFAWTVEDLLQRAENLVQTFSSDKLLYADIAKAVQGYLVKDETKTDELKQNINYNKKRNKLAEFYARVKPEKTQPPPVQKYSQLELAGLRDGAKIVETLVRGNYRDREQKCILEDIVEYIISIPDDYYDQNELDAVVSAVDVVSTQQGQKIAPRAGPMTKIDKYVRPNQNSSQSSQRSNTQTHDKPCCDIDCVIF